MLKKYICVLCNQEITDENNTKEHIIPNSLGGKRVLKNFICIDCNSKTGQTWDAAIARKFAPFCTMFGIKKDRGNVAPLRVSTISGKEYKQNADGTFVPLNPKLNVEKGEKNSKNIKIQARTINEANLILNGLHKKLKFGDEDLKYLQDQIKISTSYLDEPIQHEFSFDSEESGKSIIKSLLALAMNGGINPFECDLALNYLIKDEEPNYGFYYSDNDLIKNRKVGIPIHCLHIKAIKKTKQVLGYAEYFGLLRIVSCLSQNYTGDDQEITYAINPMSGNEIDLDIELNFSNEEIQKIYDYEFFKVDDFELILDNIMKTAIEFSENRERDRVIKFAVNEAQKLNDPQKSKEENAHIISKKIVECMEPYLDSLLRKAP